MRDAARGARMLARLLAAAAAALLIAGCSARGRAGSPAPIIPVPVDNGARAAADTAGSAAGGASDASRPRISIDPSLSVLQVVSANLDADAVEEQVIAVRNTADVASPVRILVADADPAQGTYFYQSWETDTQAVDAHSFSLSVEDVVGDHTKQIVASGMSADGQLTLDIFHTVPAHATKGLAFRPIFQVVADEVSIGEADRPDSYTTEQQPGAAFPIQVYLRDPDAQDSLDLVGVLYSWRPSESRYVAGPAQKIPGANAQQETLKTLYHSQGEEAFERFIAGSWVQDDSAGGGKTPDSSLSIIDFDVQGRRIAVASGTAAEDVYDWTESHRTIFNTLRVAGENVTVPKIRLVRRFSITADSPTSITVKVTGDDTTETVTTAYTRITDEQKARILNGPGSRVATPPVQLAGEYAAPGGPSLEFGASTLRWQDTGSSQEGTYVLFSLGPSMILTTRLASAPGAAPVTRSWLVTYRERKDGTALVRSLTLASVRLTVAGYEDANGPSYAFTQTVAAKKGG